MIHLSTVLEALTGVEYGKTSLNFTEAFVDSRTVGEGGLFFALPGEHTEGHHFVGDAFEKGALLAVVEQPVADGQLFDTRQAEFNPQQVEAALSARSKVSLLVENSLKALHAIAAAHRRQFPLRVIGVTGSVGKSTSKELIHSVLSEKFRTLKNPGNQNNEIGLPLTLLRLTPDYEAAVLEMGFYVPGEIRELCDMALPEIGVITNIGTVHAERAGSQEAIARGKAELVQALPAEGYAVLNYDDPLVLPMASQTQARVFTYGLDPRADLWADELTSFGLEGIGLRLNYHGDELSIRVPLLGRHSVHTVLRAAAVGILMGIPIGEIIQGMKTARYQMRLMTVRTRNGAMVIDDSYNAAPESTLAALNLLQEMNGRRIAVLGDMRELGPYERQGHELVGARVAEVADFYLAVGPISKIALNAARRAGMSAGRSAWVEDAAQAIEFLKPMLSKNDVVLVKGSRSLHLEQIVTALEVGE